jgi:hypothetical protein
LTHLPGQGSPDEKPDKIMSWEEGGQDGNTARTGDAAERLTEHGAAWHYPSGLNASQRACGRDL